MKCSMRKWSNRAKRGANMPHDHHQRHGFLDLTFNRRDAKKRREDIRTETSAFIASLRFVWI